MVRMSRAGRKEMMYKAIAAHDRKHENGYLPVAKIAHAAGLKSSSEVRKMLYEMVEDGLIVDWMIEPYFEARYFVLGFALAKYEQTTYLDAGTIMINGVSYNRNGELLEDVAI